MEHIKNFTDYLVRQSWQVAILFLLVAVGSFLLRNKSSHWRYLLWCVILAKCLLPPVMTFKAAVLPADAVQQNSATIEKTPSIKLGANYDEPRHPASFSTSPRQVNQETNLQRESGIENQEFNNQNSNEPRQSVGGANRPHYAVIDYVKEHFYMFVFGVWGIGVIAFLIVAGVKAFLLNRWILRHRQLPGEDVLGEIEKLKSTVSSEFLGRIWVVEKITQPFVWGLWRGCVYLPARSKNSADVIMHELAHIIRLDAFVNLLQIFAQAIFWFHPFVWVANNRIRAEREKSCDEIAIARLNISPRSYSSAVVDVLVREYQARRALPSLAVAGPVKNIEERIRTIMAQGKKFYSRPTTAAVITVLVLAVVSVPTTVALTKAEEPQRHPASSATTPRQAEDTEINSFKIPAEYIGHWQGQARIIVNWTKQKNLPIDAKIHSDGTVEGKVGDATLVNGRLVLKSWVYTKVFRHENPYLLTADLQGDIIKSESIRRDKVYISLRIENGKIDGGLGTSGTKTGSKENMILSAADVSLVRIDENNTQTTNDSKTSGFIATLSNGTIVELVGICEHPSKGQQWWSPNGSLMKNAPDTNQILFPAIEAASGRSAMVAILKIENFNDGIGFRYVINGAQNSSSSGSGDQKMYALCFDQAKENSQTNIKIGIGSGQWKTVMKHNSGFDGVSSKQNIIWHSPTEKNGNAVLNVSHSLIDQNTRIIAFDQTGKEYAGNSNSGINEGFESIQTTFLLSLSQIKEFQLQTRPYEWVEFKNVSLKPNFKTDVQIGTVEDSRKLLMERRDILKETLQHVEMNYDAGRADSKQLGQAKIDLLRVEIELAQTPQKRIELLSQIVTIYAEQEKLTKLFLDAGRATQDELNKVKLQQLDAEEELTKAKAGTERNIATEDTESTEVKKEESTPTQIIPATSEIERPYLKNVKFKITDEDTGEPIANRELGICRFVYIDFEQEPNSPSPYLNKSADFYITSVITDANGVFTLDLSSFGVGRFVVAPNRPYMTANFERSCDLSHTQSEECIRIFGGNGNKIYNLKEKTVKNIPFTGEKKEQPYEFIQLFTKRMQTVPAERIEETNLNRTPLHLAAMNGHREMVEMLLSKGSDVNAKDSDGNTPLHFSAAGGHLDLCGFLLEKGADANAKNLKGRTPLDMSAFNGHQETAELLITKGAVMSPAGQDANGIGEKQRLQNLVEDFFKNNYRDITARKTIEWGEPIVDANGNMSIRYKYEATIWGKDKIITNQLFVFDKDGKVISFNKIEDDITLTAAETNISDKPEVYIVKFRPNNRFNPQTPRELLDVFNDTVKGRVKTHHFRTKIENNILAGYILCDSKAEQKAIALMLADSSEIEFVGFQLATEDKLARHYASEQQSFNTVSKGTAFDNLLSKNVTVDIDKSPGGGERLSVQYAVIAVCEAAGVPYKWDKSAKLAEPQRRSFIKPLHIKDKPARDAIADILKPVGLDYATDSDGLFIYKK